jgi:hypothetical protein
MRHHVSGHDVRPAIYFGGPRPRALGVDHAFGVVPSSRCGDGCSRGRDRFEDGDVRGLIPRSRLQYIQWLEKLSQYFGIFDYMLNNIGNKLWNILEILS